MENKRAAAVSARILTPAYLWLLTQELSQDVSVRHLQQVNPMLCPSRSMKAGKPNDSMLLQQRLTLHPASCVRIS